MTLVAVERRGAWRASGIKATLLTPVVGVLSAAAWFGEPLGMKEVLALGLTLGGVALALRTN